jgi:cation transport ATPase
MNTLVSIGTGTAFFYSVAVTLWPNLASADGSSSFVYYDTAAMIITRCQDGTLYLQILDGDSHECNGRWCRCLDR